MMPILLISDSGSVKSLPGISQASLSRAAQQKAMNRLAAGPAAATQNMSCLGLRRRLKLTGTGLA